MIKMHGKFEGRLPVGRWLQRAVVVNEEIAIAGWSDNKERIRFPLVLTLLPGVPFFKQSTGSLSIMLGCTIYPVGRVLRRS